MASQIKERPDWWGWGEEHRERLRNWFGVKE